jgi:hypothetical protein
MTRRIPWKDLVDSDCPRAGSSSEKGGLEVAPQRHMTAAGEHQPPPIWPGDPSRPGGPARRALSAAANVVGSLPCNIATRRPKGRNVRSRRSLGMVFAMCTSMLLSQAGPAASVDLMQVFRPQRQSQGLPVSARPTSVPCVRRCHVSARDGQQVCCPSASAEVLATLPRADTGVCSSATAIGHTAQKQPNSLPLPLRPAISMAYARTISSATRFTNRSLFPDTFSRCCLHELSHSPPPQPSCTAPLFFFVALLALLTRSRWHAFSRSFSPSLFLIRSRSVSRAPALSPALSLSRLPSPLLLTGAVARRARLLTKRALVCCQLVTVSPPRHRAPVQAPVSS